MLSHHEVATLFLMNHTPKIRWNFDPDDLNSLVEHEVVTLERVALGQLVPA